MASSDGRAKRIAAAAVATGAGCAIAYRAWTRWYSSWDRALERCLPSIVVIRANYVKPFDGDQAGAGHATGFVVDAKRGLILTNRHVVSTGPIRAEATFLNKEEVRRMCSRRVHVVNVGQYAGSSDHTAIRPSP
jgi:S1-C subfamily serine protease